MAEEIASHADELAGTARFYSGWWADVKSLFLATWLGESEKES